MYDKIIMGIVAILGVLALLSALHIMYPAVSYLAAKLTQ